MKNSISEFQVLSLILQVIHSIVAAFHVLVIGLDFLEPTTDRNQYVWGCVWGINSCYKPQPHLIL